MLVGAFFLSPLTDFLPVDLWAVLSRAFKSQGGTVYFRVVPGVQSYLFPWVCLVAGVLAILLGHWLSRRGRRN